MSSEAQVRTLTVMCPHCRDLIEVADPASLILALHIANVCPEVEQIVGAHDG